MLNRVSTLVRRTHSPQSLVRPIDQRQKMVNDASSSAPDDVAIDVKLIIFDRGTVVTGADIPALHSWISQAGQRQRRRQWPLQADSDGKGMGKGLIQRKARS